MDFDLKAMINDKADYVVYNTMFDRDYLMGLLEEMLWIEDEYKRDFIDSNIKRNSGPEVPDGQYNNYHRVCKVYWLTFLKKEHYP